jgi:hypothetical protein
VVARLWRGWTRPEDGDAYAQFLRSTVFPSLAGSVPGYRGGYVLRRAAADEDEFVVVTLFDSLDAVRVFAGDDYETPVIEPGAARLLRRGDERALHFEAVVIHRVPKGGS